MPQVGNIGPWANSEPIVLDAKTLLQLLAGGFLRRAFLFVVFARSLATLAAAAR
jgi:hypothetical protein